METCIILFLNVDWSNTFIFGVGLKFKGLYVHVEIGSLIGYVTANRCDLERSYLAFELWGLEISKSFESERIVEHK